MRDLTQRQGKELSFNNLLDIDAAMWAVACWTNRPACAIIKHTTPCGIAVAALGGRGVPEGARHRPGVGLRLGDRLQHRGRPGHRPGDERPLRRGRRRAVVPRRGARGLRGKKNAAGGGAAGEPRRRARSTSSGCAAASWCRTGSSSTRPTRTGRSPPTASPPSAEWNDLRFAWAAVASVKSNAILLARDEMAIGIGAGQMSRVDSVFLAVHKARQQGHDPAGSVLASDGFFPFADGVEEAAAAGRHRDHPARRLGARRRSDRGRQPARHRDGHDGPPPVPALTRIDYDRDRRRSARPTCWALGHLRRRARRSTSHPRADHGVLGHLRVHRRRQGARHSRTRRATRCS